MSSSSSSTTTTRVTLSQVDFVANTKNQMRPFAVQNHDRFELKFTSRGDLVCGRHLLTGTNTSRIVYRILFMLRTRFPSSSSLRPPFEQEVDVSVSEPRPCSESEKDSWLHLLSREQITEAVARAFAELPAEYRASQSTECFEVTASSHSVYGWGRRLHAKVALSADKPLVFKAEELAPFTQMRSVERMFVDNTGGRDLFMPEEKKRSAESKYALKVVRFKDCADGYWFVSHVNTTDTGITGHKEPYLHLVHTTGKHIAYIPASQVDIMPQAVQNLARIPITRCKCD